jgi:hypothetical protein
MSKNLQLEMNQIIGMDPIFRGLSNEGTLGTSGGRIALNWVSAGSHEIIQAGELDYESIPIVLIERPPFQIVADERSL